MNKQINLIPLELTVPASSIKLSSTIYKFSVILTIVFIVIMLGAISFFVYYKFEINKASLNIKNLKNKIVQLEKNEQKLILAKDKLSKISYIKSTDVIDNELNAYESFHDLVSSDESAVLSDININAKKTELSLSISDTPNLIQVLNKVYALTDYKSAILNSLSYNPDSGYQFKLTLQD